ncbi:MAG TPA: DUF721 domain-containing protein [Bacteroidia bacterium]|nr:DUF721 domain-containing protein [Bacteroidia bacterium]HNT80275.1 DUF721 domain-containing protein [Bacteroidia bacterium]
MSRDSESKSIKDTLNDLLGSGTLGRKVVESQIKEIWTREMGTLISNRTTKIVLKGSTLYVNVNSSPLADQLNLEKDKVIDNLNTALRSEVVHELVINRKI